MKSFCIETLISLAKLNQVMWWNALYRLKALQLLPLLVWSGTGLVFISSSSACSSSSSSAQPPKRPEAGGTKVTVCADCIWGPWAERKKWLQILLYNYTMIRYAKWVINPKIQLLKFGSVCSLFWFRKVRSCKRPTE